MQNNKGFTLIEMLVTIAIIGVLMRIALPATRDMQASMRVNSAANDFVAALKSTRSDAIMKRRHQTMVAISNTNDWGSKGWSVTELLNGVVRPVSDFKGLPKTVTIKVIPVTTGPAPAAVTTFRFEGASGRAQYTNASPLNVIFRVCDTGSKNERGRDIRLNQFGQIGISTHPSNVLCTL